jgi:hypothetical protein
VRPARTQSKMSPDLPPRQQGTCSVPNRAGSSFLILRHALVYSNVLKAVEMGKMRVISLLFVKTAELVHHTLFRTETRPAKHTAGFTPETVARCS